MKAVKYIGQIIAAILYTCLFTGIMYLIIVLPLGWILSLSTWLMILLFIFLGGLIQAIQTTLVSYASIPYIWIVKKNIVSLSLSILLIVFNMFRSCVMLWNDLSKQGVIAIVFAIVVTIIIILFIVGSVSGIIGYYNETKYE